MQYFMSGPSSGGDSDMELIEALRAQIQGLRTDNKGLVAENNLLLKRLAVFENNMGKTDVDDDEDGDDFVNRFGLKPRKPLPPKQYPPGTVNMAAIFPAPFRKASLPANEDQVGHEESDSPSHSVISGGGSKEDDSEDDAGDVGNVESAGALKKKREFYESRDSTSEAEETEAGHVAGNSDYRLYQLLVDGRKGVSFVVYDVQSRLWCIPTRDLYRSVNRDTLKLSFRNSLTKRAISPSMRLFYNKHAVPTLSAGTVDFYVYDSALKEVLKNIGTSTLAVMEALVKCVK